LGLSGLRCGIRYPADPVAFALHLLPPLLFGGWRYNRAQRRTVVPRPLFVYPLKYLVTQFSVFTRSLAEGAPRPPFSLEDAQLSLIVLALGYIAVFAMLAALYWRALGSADQLDLSPRERHLTRFGVVSNVIHASIGLAVLIGAWLIPLSWSPFAGFFFFLIGPLMFWAGATLAPDRTLAPKPYM
jgi:hypothetical protein